MDTSIREENSPGNGQNASGNVNSSCSVRISSHSMNLDIYYLSRYCLTKRSSLIRKVHFYGPKTTGGIAPGFMLNVPHLSLSSEGENVLPRKVTVTGRTEACKENRLGGGGGVGGQQQGFFHIIQYNINSHIWGGGMATAVSQCGTYTLLQDQCCGCGAASFLRFRYREKINLHSSIIN